MELLLQRSRMRKQKSQQPRNPAPSGQLFQEIDSNFDHLLPFSLQNLCLLEVINDLDSYPVELLASMPKWFRNKLLDNLPILDLNHLDQTEVAKDVNVDTIWFEHFNSLVPVTSRLSRFVGDTADIKYCDRLEKFHMSCESRIFKNKFSRVGRIGQALKDIRGTIQTTTKEDCLLKLTAAILTNKCSFSRGQDEKTMLISVDGCRLFRNLLMQYPTDSSPEQIYPVLRKQNTALKLVTVETKDSESRFQRRQAAAVPEVSKTKAIMLIPRHLLQHYECSDHTSRMLSILANECCVRPPTANIEVNIMSRQILAHLHTERYAHENGLILSSHQMTCVTSINQILSAVKVLRFSCLGYANIGAMISLIEAITAKENDCQLQSLFCELQDLYPDLVKPLTALFHLQNFNKLTLELSGVYHVNFVKLIHGFMTAPCSDSQTLNIVVKDSRTYNDFYLPAQQTNILPYTLEKKDLGRLDICWSTIPLCSIEHKVIRALKPENKRIRARGPLSIQSHDADILHVVLQFSTVRLNEIYIDSYKDLHLCALHPDLQMMKVELNLRDSEKILENTAREDFATIFKIPVLQEIKISGNWGYNVEVKSGLVLGLYRRAGSQSPVPLKMICLNDRTQGYSEVEYQELWDAIFSLSNIEQLEIILSKLVSKHKCSIELIFQRWIKSAKKGRLKCISINELEICEMEHRQLSQFAQSHSMRMLHQMKSMRRDQILKRGWKTDITRKRTGSIRFS